MSVVNETCQSSGPLTSASGAVYSTPRKVWGAVLVGGPAAVGTAQILNGPAGTVLVELKTPIGDTADFSCPVGVIFPLGISVVIVGAGAALYIFSDKFNS